MMLEPHALSVIGGWILALFGGGVSLDYLGRLRKLSTAPHPGYRTPWLIVGGMLLGGGMWAAHFLWSNALYGGFDTATDLLPLSLGLIISCIGAIALLWACSGEMAPGPATLAAALLIFFSVLCMSHLWVLGHELAPVEQAESLLAPAIELLCGATLLRLSWQFPRHRSNKWPRAGAAMAMLGLSLTGYASLRISYILAGQPLDDRMSAVGSLVVFLHGAVILMAAGVVSYFERRFSIILERHRNTERALRDSKNQARATVATAFDAFISIDDDGVIRDWNEQAEKLLGWAAEEVLGHDRSELSWGDALGFPSARDEEEIQKRHESFVYSKDGRGFPVEVSLWTSDVAGERRTNVFLHDISDRKMAAKRLSAQTMAAEALLASKTTKEASARVLPAICGALDWPVGALWLANEAETEACCIGFWTTNDRDFEDFRKGTEDNRLPLGIGIPGRVLQSGKPLWIEDITRDSNFRRSSATEKNSLISGFGFPIKGADGILGVMEFYTASMQSQDDQLLEMMDTVGNLFGSFLQNARNMEELGKEQAFLSALLENLSDGIVACDKNGVLSLFNRATREFQGLDQEPIYSEDWAKRYNLWEADGITPLARDHVPLYRAWKGEVVRDAEIVVVKPDGERTSLVCNGQPLRGEQGELLGAVIAMHDVTEKKQIDEKLRKLAHYDTLTELPNRSLFYNTLAKEIEIAKRDELCLCVMFLDLDKFKEVNDSMGHSHGDRLLQQVSHRLVGSLRAGDTVGRLGGDEFAVILPGPESAQAVAHVAEKIRQAIAEPFELGGRVVNVSTSIGITCYPQDTSDIDTLVRYADTAMYAAKASGKNQYRFYTPKMNQEAIARMETEAALRVATAKSQFFIQYQPKVDLQTGVITGLEALLRWKHPLLGTKMPASFIHILEDTGMINEVGAWVLEAVCAQIEKWQAMGVNCPRIAINVSARQMSKYAHERGGHPGGEFGDVILSLLDKHPSSATKLDLEITESSIMTSSEQSFSLLEKLRTMGVGIAIDDFGTGYSSLSYLKRLPVNSIKIDQEFVRDVASDQEDAAIISAIINMSHSLGLRVVAEGVETEEQLLFLIEHGCDEVQGYLISRPIEAPALPSFLAAFRGEEGLSAVADVS